MFIKRLFIALILLFTSFHIFSEDLMLSEAEKTWLKEHPVIRLGVGTSFPPIQYVTGEKGEYEFRGIASDYVEILSALLEVDFVIEYGITFSQALEMGQRKEIDLFPCLAYSEERDEFLDFTNGYLENPMVIFANEDAPFIGSIQDLSGLRVADVEALYVYRNLKRDVPGIDFVLTENSENCLEKVAFGQADANVTGLISGSYIIRKNNWSNIKVASPTPYPNTVFRMAARDDWPELAVIIDKALQSIEPDNRNEINRKWIAVRYEYGISQSNVVIRMLLVGGISAVVVALALMWIFRLRREIKRRKKVEKSLSIREAELREMVSEKEILIREVYHRVKNNLTLVSSLVRLQASKLSAPGDVDKMGDVIHRIDSIMLLHDKLSLSHDLKNIDISDYLAELILGLKASWSNSRPGVKILHDTLSTFFDSKAVIPLGLIINELVTNALKYGFTKGSSGEIKISLVKKTDGSFLLSVKNNGTPIPEDIEPAKAKSLGLMLVSNLTIQLKGELFLTRSPETEFEISFPYPG
ncbi:MAG: transporter substrate-binding domain-containing protein [Spirochaetales bacterium]|nr:transporter substrate-binding domain-containing protein [Spirochaetales bacterium]